MGSISYSQYGTPGTSSLFDSSGNVVGGTEYTGGTVVAFKERQAARDMLASGQLTINKDEKTFSFGETNFNDQYKAMMAPLNENLQARAYGNNALTVYKESIDAFTGNYLSTYRDLTKQGFQGDTTSINIYNQALTTSAQSKGQVEIDLISLANPKATYKAYKTADGWVSQDPYAPVTSSAALKTERSARPGAPEVAELGEKRRAGAQAASFLGLSSTESKSSILSGE
jgi:hypothetical protein